MKREKAVEKTKDVVRIKDCRNGRLQSAVEKGGLQTADVYTVYVQRSRLCVCQ